MKHDRDIPFFLLNVKPLTHVRKAALSFLLLCGLAAPLASAQAIDDTQDTPAIALTQQTRQLITQALHTAEKKRWPEAHRLMAQTHDKAAMALYDWLFFVQTEDSVDFDRISDFMRDHPDWPRQGTLKALAEQSMPGSLSELEVIDWFDNYSPVTVRGMMRYAEALINQRQSSIASQRLSEWWPKATMGNEQQATVLARYERMITREAQIARFNTTLFRKQYTNARALAKSIGKGYPLLAEARIGLAENGKNINALVAAVPASLQDDPGFMLERLRWRRKNDMDFGAIEILQNMPPAEQIPNLNDWWKERNIIIRRLIDRKDYKTAYLVASKHGLKEGPDFAAGEFMAGWLALRFTKHPEKAFKHFETLYNNAASPISKSRGAYWAGKASEALHSNDIATQWYRVSAQYQTAYYGQMALSELQPADRPAQQKPPVRNIAAESRFFNRSIVKAARYLNQAGYWKETTEFLDAMASDIQDPDEYLLIADLAVSLDHYHNAVRIGKKGLEKNIMMVDYAFPTILPRMKNVHLEWALVHGLIRQESQFDREAQSPVGARGLMQLMPTTAKEVARKMGIAHQTDWLTARPDHNITLGEEYLEQLLERYDGSYPLALAAYNGGMGNVDKWINRFGDPRTKQISMTDWIELIPFDETRNYVQRVMEATYIYRLKMKAIQKSASTPLHVSLE